MEAFIGTVLPVAFNYPPRGWVFCNGQTLPVSQNAALFALVSTMYGGDGRTTFGVPDLRGRLIVGSQAPGPGLTPITQGGTGGANNITVTSVGSPKITLSVNELPAHNHTLTVTGSAFSALSTLNATTQTTGAQAAATGATLSSTQGLTGATQAAIYQTTAPAASTMKALSTSSVTTTVGGTANVTSGSTGNADPVTINATTTAQISVMQPYTGLNYIICTQGLYPARN